MVLLRKPSDYFKEDENISVDNSVKNLIETGELEVNTFSDAFNSFKENISKIETLSEYSETLDDYKLNIEKVNFLSEKIESIETEIQNFLTRKDLDIAVMSQLFVVEKNIKDIQSKVKSINQSTLTEIRLDASNLAKVVNNFINDEVPKYKKSLVETEVRSSNLCRELESNVNQTVTDINEFVDNKYDEVSKLIVEINESIVKNESYLKSRNQTLEDLQEHILTTFSEINLEKIEKKNRELSKKIKYIEEVFEKFDENKILNENLLVEPPSTNNQDPLTPLDKKFVTLDQLQEHYRLFINRIQQQLASIGGSGETKLKYLDDIVGIATNPSVYNNKFLKYKHEIKAFEFVEVSLDYATNAGIASYADAAGITTALQYPRDFSISGDVATASSVSFDGTNNVNLFVALSNNFSANTVGIITASQLSTGLTGIGINTNTISGPSIIFIDPAGVGDNTGAVRIKGDLYVDGSQFVVNSSTIELADLRVGIATTVGTNFLLDGGGIGIGSANILKTFTYNSSSDSLKSSENLDINTGKTYKIGGTNVLSSTTLESGVTNSSLTSVGTLISLSVGNVYSTGIITATKFVGSVGFATTSFDVIGGIASVTQLNVSGITTLGVTSTTNLTSQQLKVSGISTLGVTSTTNLTSQTLIVSGISTLGVTSTTNLTSQQLNVSGITTLGVTSTTNLTSQQLNVSGITTLGVTSTTNLTSQTLNVSGITTLGVTSTTNLTSQQLNVSGIITAAQFVTGASGAAIGINTNTISGPATITIDPAGVGDNTGAVRIKGDLFVDGTQFIVNSTTIELADFIVGIASTATTDILADGAGIKIGPDNTLTYDHTNTSLKSSENFNLASGKTYKVDGTPVLSNNTLGSGVTNSSLTSVGTLTNLSVNNVTGVSTLGITSTTNLTSQTLNVSGISTLGVTSTTNLTSQQLKVSGISTLGVTSTTNLTSQTLNVSGFSTVGVLTATSIGIGTTNPTAELFVIGNSRITGIVTVGTGNTGIKIDGTTGIISSSNPGFSTVTYFGNLIGNSTNVIGGIASLISLSVSGVTTVGVLTATRIGIGTTNPTSELYVNGDVFVTGIITSTDFNSASDIKLKSNIKKIDNPIDKIIRIDGVTFDWKINNRSSMGVIAQNIEKVLPQLVSGEDSKTVNYNGIIGLLIECVKTQQEQIDDLNMRFDKLSK